MTYKEKAVLFKELAHKENRGACVKWRNREEFAAYLEMWGGRMKSDLRRRRGYLVSFMQDPVNEHPRVVAEVPMDFAMKVLTMGGFP